MKPPEFKRHRLQDGLLSSPQITVCGGVPMKPGALLAWQPVLSDYVHLRTGLVVAVDGDAISVMWNPWEKRDPRALAALRAALKNLNQKRRK